MSAELKQALFRINWNLAVTDRAVLIANHAFDVCQLGSSSASKLTDDQEACVDKTSNKLWGYFKAADAQLPPAFFTDSDN
jgi:hypothetical protein